MREMKIAIPGRPMVKQSTNFGKGRAFPKKHVVAWETHAAMLMRTTLGESEQLQGPIALTIDAIWERPKRLCRKQDPDGRIYKWSRPDFDNCAKAVCDALNLSGVIVDDAQFCDCHVRKWYAAKGEGPCVEITLRALEP